MVRCKGARRAAEQPTLRSRVAANGFRRWGEEAEEPVLKSLHTRFMGACFVSVNRKPTAVEHLYSS
jgi:hypothetical protein